MRLTIIIDAPEALALELVPEGSLGTYGDGSVKTSLSGSLIASGPHGSSVVVWQPVDAELIRELTRAERTAKLDAEYFDEEFS